MATLAKSLSGMQTLMLGMQRAAAEDLRKSLRDSFAELNTRTNDAIKAGAISAIEAATIEARLNRIAVRLG